jgi:hypothetical protein
MRHPQVTLASRRGTPLAFAAACAAFAFATPAAALDDDLEGTPRAAAADDLAGKLAIRAGAEVVGPVGSASTEAAMDDIAGTGLGAAGAVGLGLSRYAELSLQGGWAKLSSAARCEGCGGTSARVGVGLTYHLSQGVAFDPWARFGAAYRTTTLDTDGATSRAAREVTGGTYHGVDFAQISLGTIWSPTAAFGFGPYIEMDLGSYLGRPEGASSPSAYAFFTLGFQVQLMPSRGGATTATAAQRDGDGSRTASSAPSAPSF